MEGMEQKKTWGRKPIKSSTGMLLEHQWHLSVLSQLSLSFFRSNKPLKKVGGGGTEIWGSTEGLFAASHRTTVSPSAPKDKAEAAVLPSVPMIPRAPCYIFQWCGTKCCWAVQDA